MNRGLSLVSALGFGAGLMYLMDPDRGNKRRKQITKQARSVAKKTRGSLDDISSDVMSRAQALVEAVPDVTERARDRASDFGQYVSKRARKISARDLGSRARELASSGIEAGSRARSAVSDLDVAESARDLADGFGKSLRRYAIQLLELDRGLSRTTWGLIGLCTGAGLMFILDPAQGTQRRALVSEKVTQTFKGEGRVADLSHEASAMAQRFMTQVRSMVGSKVEDKDQEWHGETVTGHPNYTPHA